jgi:hypothetical protein
VSALLNILVTGQTAEIPARKLFWAARYFLGVSPDIFLKKKCIILAKP